MQLKKFAAAAAIACSTVPAFAGINAAQQAGLNAEVWAQVWDEAKGTYAIDFGITVGDLLSRTQSFILGSVGANDAAWNQLVAADGNLFDFSQFAGTRWAVFAVSDIVGYQGEPGGQYYYTTTTGNTPIVTIDSSLEQSFNLMGEFGFAGTLNQSGLGTNPAVNGSTFNLVGHPANFIESGYAGGYGIFAGNAIATSFGVKQTLWSCTNGAFFDGTQPSNCGQAQNISIGFDGEKFAAFVVPEPGTYGMLAAGLLVVGFVARRRRAA